ncbi:hypothetical protein D9611_012597 [Ephemerocybe angulata]|uniref:Uncharacterized protein n=1 Tax=Ephemerocybe angulata TaxID=980116 RepID=A0A8H5AUK8_9AGAR|nr:hypothetical protein D9611_012597 [Tulosesus angulatus]
MADREELVSGPARSHHHMRGRAFWGRKRVREWWDWELQGFSWMETRYALKPA